jgi:sugar-phosphatase
MSNKMLTKLPSAMEFMCTAILFDLDGVLVNSSAVVKRHWERWAIRHHVSFERVMEVAHGRTSAEIIRLVAPHLNAQREGRLREAAEGADTDGLEVFASARELLRGLPAGSWAVVTSGDSRTATTRLRYGDFPPPPVLVTADDVRRGKPEPEAYLLAAQRLGVPSGQCMVVEDAPAGIEAAHAAGMRAIAVATTHRPQALGKADIIVRELANVMVKTEGDRLRVILEPIQAA